MLATNDDEIMDEEAGRILFAQSCSFIAGVTGDGKIPVSHLPEIAFAGRSNVGKSSLVNALTGRSTLARVSKTPGRTRQLNFFELGRRLGLVDLPGYGFAKAPKGEIRAWTEMMRTYLSGRANLRRVCILIDSRHGTKPSDIEFMDLLDETAVSYQLVLTKTDQINQAEGEDRKREFAALARHGALHPRLISTSARTGAGIALLRAELAALALPAGLALPAANA
ncbi:MAG: YihA family ribosome biogenesis GTP-binding protein [Alphaproteobacteria bacterium]|nr:YihA family ribosome biogenesis GTP-binding protein [Alphaproteobacteria bacterium]